MKCKVCGNKTIKESDTCYVCEYCLTEYVLDLKTKGGGSV